MIWQKCRTESYGWSQDNLEGKEERNGGNGRMGKAVSCIVNKGDLLLPGRPTDKRSVFGLVLCSARSMAIRMSSSQRSISARQLDGNREKKKSKTDWNDQTNSIPSVTLHRNHLNPQFPSQVLTSVPQIYHCLCARCVPGCHHHRLALTIEGKWMRDSPLLLTFSDLQKHTWIMNQTFGWHQ